MDINVPLNFLYESIDFESISCVNEEDKITKSKSWHIKGPYVQLNKKNNNSRIYRDSIVDPEIKNFLPLISSGLAHGCLGHPPGTPNTIPAMVSHHVESLIKDGNYWMGDSIIYDNPNGKIIQSILEKGKKVCVSSRATGTVNPASNEVEKDYSLKAFDCVIMPGGQDCVMTAVYENLEFITQARPGMIPAAEKFETACKNAKDENSITQAIDLFLWSLSL